MIQIILRVNVFGVRRGREEGSLTGMFARCFADPTKFILALCEKRAERARIEKISSAKDLICKKTRRFASHAGAPWEQPMRDHAHRGEEKGKKKEGGAYGKSSTTPEPVTRIRQLIRAPRKTAPAPTPADRSQRLRLHVQQPAHRRVPLDALQARLRCTCVVGWDEVQRREGAIRRSAERLALWRLSVSTFVRLTQYVRRWKEGQGMGNTHPTALDMG
jgi:hypothetical protein